MSKRIRGWGACLGFCAMTACGRVEDTVPDALASDAGDGAVEAGNPPGCPTIEGLLSDERCSEALAGTRCFYPCNSGDRVWTTCGQCHREDPRYYWCVYESEKC